MFIISQIVFLFKKLQDLFYWFYFEDTNPIDEKSIALIQQKWLNYKSKKKVKLQIQESRIKKQKEKELYLSRIKGISPELLQKIPYEIWVAIFQYVGDFQLILKLSQSNQQFQEIYRFNNLWKSCFQKTFPKKYALTLEEVDYEKTNWKNFFQDNYKLFKTFYQILFDLQVKKNRANATLRENDLQQSKLLYEEAIISYLKLEEEDFVYKDIMNYHQSLQYMKIICILYSNSSDVEIKLKNWPKAIMQTSRSLKKLKEIKSFMRNDQNFLAEFESLEKNLRKKFSVAYTKLPLQLFSYSNEQVEELDQGIIIKHKGLSFGIFRESMVFMTEMERNHSVKGVIINKMTTIQGESVRIGGPCENDVVTILHNIPNLDNSRQIIEGVWEGGNVDSYRNNPDFKIREYYGYASWFEGQLDGECRQDRWEIIETVTANDVFCDENIITIGQ